MYSPKRAANWGHLEMTPGNDLTSYRDTEFFIQAEDDGSGSASDNKSERVRGQDYASRGWTGMVDATAGGDDVNSAMYCVHFKATTNSGEKAETTICSG